MEGSCWLCCSEPDFGLRLAGVTPEMRYLIERKLLAELHVGHIPLTTRSGSSVVPLLDGGQQLGEAFGVINMY